MTDHKTNKHNLGVILYAGQKKVAWILQSHLTMRTLYFLHKENQSVNFSYQKVGRQERMMKNLHGRDV